jgi:hypothetical protein
MDPRTTPARADVAALFLKGEVNADRYVEAEATQVIAPFADLWERPGGRRASQLLALDRFEVFDRARGFAWGQNRRDGYVGYVAETALEAATESPTHRVATAWAHVFPEPAIKAPPVRPPLPFMAALVAGRSNGAWQVAAGGWCPVTSLVPLDRRLADPAGIAEKFLGVPYLWGGNTPLGFDCSGLVQMVFLAAGLPLPRDSDQQEQALAAAIPGAEPLQRGDLVFWPGHVGIMADRETLIHANAHAMAVAKEPLAAVVARAESPVTSRRRPQI